MRLFSLRRESHMLAAPAAFACLPDSCSYNNISNPVGVLSGMMIYWSRSAEIWLAARLNFVGIRAMLGTKS